MNRTEFQQLAEVRIEEAGVLLAAGKWDGAYYLAGYAVECALKACVAKLTKAEEFPPRETRDYYTHDLNALIRAAKLTVEHAAEVAARPPFRDSWRLAVAWSEQARYDRKAKAAAEDLHRALTDPTDGVLQWVRRYW